MPSTASTQYRDVSGAGGYTYRQYSDGTIQIIGYPEGKDGLKNKVYKPDSRDCAWVAITNEIGAPSNATWKDKVPEWAAACAAKTTGSKNQALSLPATVQKPWFVPTVAGLALLALVGTVYAVRRSRR